MKEIPLTQGQVAIVDDEDYEWLMRRKWSARYDKESHTWYAMSRNLIRDGGNVVYMHRIIMGAGRGEQIDHIHHNGLDNRKSELRICTGSQNTTNKRLQSNNTSGAKGVTFCKASGKYQTQIKVEGRLIILGYYEHLESAAIAYDAAAIKYFGEFALTNKMLGLI